MIWGYVEHDDSWYEMKHPYFGDCFQLVYYLLLRVGANALRTFICDSQASGANFGFYVAIVLLVMKLSCLPSWKG